MSNKIWRFFTQSSCIQVSKKSFKNLIISFYDQLSRGFLYEQFFNQFFWKTKDNISNFVYCALHVWQLVHAIKHHNFCLNSFTIRCHLRKFFFCCPKTAIIFSFSLSLNCERDHWCRKITTTKRKMMKEVTIKEKILSISRRSLVGRPSYINLIALLAFQDFRSQLSQLEKF